MNKINEILKTSAGMMNYDVVATIEKTKQELFKAITEDKRWPEFMTPEDTTGGLEYVNGFNYARSVVKSALAEILGVKE